MCDTPYIETLLGTLYGSNEQHKFTERSILTIHPAAGENWIIPVKIN